MKDSVSLIIPCRNEEQYISKCLDSIIKNDHPKELTEVMVIDGMSTDNTVRIINEYSKKYPFIKLLKNPKKITPTAMNIGIRSSKSEYIIIMIAHGEYPQNYITDLIKWHKKLKCENVGGLFKADVINKNKKSNSILQVLSSIFGVGNALYRIGAKEPVIVDTAAFGCYKKEVFDKIGLYDERLVRNQDMELNNRLARAGGRTYLVPDIACTYFARETYRGLFKNNFGNGLWIIPTAFLTKKLSSLSLRHFIPMIFLLSLIIPALFSFLYSNLIYISLFSFTLYNLFVIIFSIILISKSTTFLNVVCAFYTLHFSYGIGSLMGIFKYIRLKLSRNK